MRDTPPRWVMPLHERPRIAMIGRGVHGLRGTVERYRLAALWCVHLYTYHAHLQLGGHRLEIRPGSASVFPPNTELAYHYQGRSEHLFAHFRLPAEPSAPDRAETSRHLPALQALGTAWAPMAHALTEAIGYFSTSPLRAEVRLWDLLWQLAAQSPASAGALPDAVQSACAMIEGQLGSPLRVPRIAEAVGLSHNHLTRLFRQHLGKTVVRYIRDRRAHVAAHLLRETTLPIKAIAHRVGMPDLHQFNKTIREAHGKSPRQLRHGC